MTPANESAQADQFSDLHMRGAERFGLLWLKVNQWISETYSAEGLDANQHKLALTKIAWAICVNLGSDYVGD